MSVPHWRCLHSSAIMSEVVVCMQETDREIIFANKMQNNMTYF